MAAPVARVGRFLRLTYVKSVGCCQICLTQRFRRISLSAIVTADTDESRNLSPTTSPISRSVTKAETIGKAMQAYMERAKAHDEFMADQIADYEIGKRHLANIMGADPETFEQHDIDHPEEIVPQRKAAQFGMDGRPFHYLFYTMKPNYYQIMHETAMKLDELKTYEDTMTAGGFLEPPDNKSLQLLGSEWIDKESLEKMVIESISEHDYKRFIVLHERLAGNPYSFREEEHLMKYRKALDMQSFSQSIEPPDKDENGREYKDAVGERKHARAKVRVWGDGTGKLSINGDNDILYFTEMYDREQVMYPIQFVDKLSLIDIDATVTDSGHSAQAGAIRLAISRALCSFVDSETAERMRLAGLMTRDMRMRERKKPGQKRARKKFTWKKR